MTLKSLKYLALVAGLAAFAQAGIAAAQHHEVVSGDAVKWGPAPPSLP